MKRACGLDVYKGSIFCVTYNGKRHGSVMEYSTLTSSIRDMSNDLHSEGLTLLYRIYQKTQKAGENQPFVLIFLPKFLPRLLLTFVIY